MDSSEKPCWMAFVCVPASEGGHVPAETQTALTDQKTGQSGNVLGLAELHARLTAGGYVKIEPYGRTGDVWIVPGTTLPELCVPNTEAIADYDRVVKRILEIIGSNNNGGTGLAHIFFKPFWRPNLSILNVLQFRFNFFRNRAMPVFCFMQHLNYCRSSILWPAIGVDVLKFFHTF
jgi:hypothetical protein